MQFMFRLDAVHVWAKWYWGSAVLGISGGLLCRASRRNYRASSSAKKPRFRCAENERNERDHRQSRIQDGDRAGCDHGQEFQQLGRETVYQTILDSTDPKLVP